MHRILPSLATLSIWNRNATIAVVIACMLVFGRPGSPDCLRSLMYPVAKWLGIWQGTWTMFGPEPSTENRRLGAKIYYQDGTVSEWSSPDWRKQSVWERLMTHRLSKYVEIIQSANYEAAWPALTDYIVDSDRRANVHSKIPTKVDLRVFRGTIPDARLGYWKPFSESIPMDERFSIYTREYASPKEPE